MSLALTARNTTRSARSRRSSNSKSLSRSANAFSFSPARASRRPWARLIYNTVTTTVTTILIIVCYTPHRRPYHTLPYFLDTVYPPIPSGLSVLRNVVRYCTPIALLLGPLSSLWISPRRCHQHAVNERSAPFVTTSRLVVAIVHRTRYRFATCISMHLYILYSNAFSCRHVSLRLPHAFRTVLTTATRLGHVHYSLSPHALCYPLIMTLDHYRRLLSWL